MLQVFFKNLIEMIKKNLSYQTTQKVTKMQNVHVTNIYNYKYL
jgi:hypothetical protein